MRHPLRPICLVILLSVAEEILPVRTSAQAIEAGPSREFTFLPGPLLVPFFSAGEQEPGIGLRKAIGSSQLTLDIGSSLDAVEYAGTVRGPVVRLGLDAFVSARTSSVNSHRLQVDAADGYIGGHLIFANRPKEPSLNVRMRVFHVSGHLIDGSWDQQTGLWKDGREPIPYTRNYLEITGAVLATRTPVMVTVYSGFSYAFLVRPATLAHAAAVLGFVVHTLDEECSLFSRPLVFYAAEHVSTNGIPDYYVSNTAEAGLKFGSWLRGGFRIYAEYYSGLDRISQNYAAKVTLWSVGLAVDVR
jgi:hypothetical protein